MNRRAVPLHAGLERAPMSVQALELGQQRRMNVEHAAAPSSDEARRQQPHEAGQANEIGVVLLKLCVQRLLKRLAILAELQMVDDCGFDSCLARPSEAGSIGLVRYHEYNFGWIVLRLRRLDQRHHV